MYNEVYQELIRQMPKKDDVGSFVVNIDYLKKQIEEVYPDFEVTIKPVGAYEFEVNLKKMVNTIAIEIDEDKILRDMD